jgi:hypothetical protein
MFGHLTNWPTQVPYQFMHGSVQLIRLSVQPNPGGEPYICRAAAAPPTLVQQLFIGNKQDTPFRAFDLGFSMHVVTRLSMQVSPYLLVCSVMVELL